MGRGSIAHERIEPVQAAGTLVVDAGREPSPRPRRAAKALAALAFYGLLVVTFTWPLATRATTDIPATWGIFHYDTLHTAWVLAHETRALATAPASVLDTN